MKDVITEKEKMLAGEIYDCGDQELLARWHKAKALQQAYNNTLSTDSAALDSLLTDLLGSKGAHVWIAAPFFVDYGEHIHIGDSVEINMNCVFLDCNKITIGNNTAIGPGVHIYTVYHPLKASERLTPGSTFWKSQTSPVTIGYNVWIGGGSIILPGVTIGDNTTIGAGSVVTKSIPANVLALGNPCKVVRNL